MLNKQMPSLEEKYANLQVISKKIQEMEYKPFIQRIKDYIIGLACIAILIMAFNMTMAKIQAVRKARKSMMQYQNMMKSNGGGEYPTI
jgi:large-conductance mechanosensitive channel